MILVLFEDQSVEVYESPEQVPDSVEGLTMEDSVLEMCDERGQRQVAEWVHPNRHARLFGVIRWSDSGAFRLRLEGGPDPQNVRSLIGRAVSFSRLAESRKYIRLEELIAALPDATLDDQLVDDILERDHAFQARVAKSKASPRKPFTPGGAG